MNIVVFVALVFAFDPKPAIGSEGKLNANAQWGQWRGPLNTGVAPL